MRQQLQKRQRRGFTLVELLVTIAIIVVLAALAFVALKRIKLAAHKAESVNNIRNLSAVTLAAAADNNGNFPHIHSPANSSAPYWFSREFREENQLTRSQCYSSANERWKPTGKDIYLSRDLWDWPDGVSSVWGYACLVNDNGWADTGHFEPPDDWRRIQNRVTAGREIRWVPERLGVEVAYPILWMDLTREWGGHMVGNFMKNDDEPRGTHIGYVDGHVEWVHGEDMKQRFTGGGDAKLFW